MAGHMLLAALALVVVSLVVALTMIWQRQARMDRRLRHVEREIGVPEDEHELTAGEKKAAETLRHRLHASERRTRDLERKAIATGERAARGARR